MGSSVGGLMEDPEMKQGLSLPCGEFLFNSVLFFPGGEYGLLFDTVMKMQDFLPVPRSGAHPHCRNSCRCSGNTFLDGVRATVKLWVYFAAPERSLRLTPSLCCNSRNSKTSMYAFLLPLWTCYCLSICF